MIFTICKGWCEQSAAALLPLIDSDIREIIENQLKGGSAKLYRVAGENVAAWLLLSFEEYPSGKELVLEAIAGRGANVITKAVLSWAKGAGFVSARFETHHSERVAKKLISGTPLERSATVFRCQL